MNLPPVVSQAEWQAAHEKLLVKEKEATRARDALAALPEESAAAEVADAWTALAAEQQLRPEFRPRKSPLCTNQ